MPYVRSASAAPDPSPLYDTAGVVGKGGEGVAGADCEEKDQNGSGFIPPPAPSAGVKHDSSRDVTMPKPLREGRLVTSVLPS